MLTLMIILMSLLLMPKYTKHSWTLSKVIIMFLSMVCLTDMYTQLNIPLYYNQYMFSDKLSAPLIALTLWITSLMFMSSQKTVITNMKYYNLYYLMIILTLVLLLTFTASNLMLFYIMFELSLIPTLLIIMGWGYQPERLQAGLYMMMYTITASIPLLLSLSMMYLNNFTLMMNITMMNAPSIFTSPHIWWMMSMIAFLVKMPMFTTHLWLPKAHVEAPVAGSMILAAILLKLGSYGLIRLIMLFQSINKYMTPVIMSISATGAVVTGLICTRQTDMKSLIAYSSVGHMSLLILGLMSNSQWGMNSSLTLMIAHGLTSSAMFSLANMNYEYTSTRSMLLNKGLMNMFPSMTLLWFIMSAANMAAPPSINLLAEIMLITSTVYISVMIIPFLATMSFISAAYTLILYTSSQHGSLSKLYNPMTQPLSRNMLTITLHAIPVYALIMKAEMSTLWM